MRPRIALCPKCHSSMTPGERFCRNCGAVICPNCQELLPQRSRYCPRCGYLCLNEPVRETSARGSATVAPPRQVLAESQRQVLAESQMPSPPPRSAQVNVRTAGGGQASGGQAVCPQCGSVIDLESGRCIGCGLLYGARHRVVQVGQATPPRYMSPHHMPQQQKMPAPPQMSMQDVPTEKVPAGHGVPPPVRPPVVAYQPPVAHAVAGGRSAGLGEYSMPSPPAARRYRNRELVEEAGASERLRQTLLKMVFAIFVVFILIFAGSGLYYFLSQGSVEVPAAPLPPEPSSTSSMPATVSPLVISNLSVASFTDMTAVITWKTDRPATSQVRYGKTEACGLSTDEVKNLVTDHTVRLSGLEPNTTYYFKAISKDASGAKAELTGESFTTEKALLVGTSPGNRAPDFTLQTIDGKKVTLSKLQGSKVILNFWATWCEPCRKEMPYIQKVHEEWSDKGVVVLAVAVSQNQALEGVKQFIKDNRYTFTVLFDAEKKVAGDYQVSEIPKTVFIDADGIVRKVQLGEFENQEQIEDILNSF